MLLTQGLNIDVEIAAQFEDEKPQRLGFFRIYEIRIDREGCSTIKWNSLSEFVNFDVLGNFVKNAENEEIKLYCKWDLDK